MSMGYGWQPMTHPLLSAAQQEARTSRNKRACAPGGRVWEARGPRPPPSPSPPSPARRAHTGTPAAMSDDYSTNVDFSDDAALFPSEIFSGVKYRAVSVMPAGQEFHTTNFDHTISTNTKGLFAHVALPKPVVVFEAESCPSKPTLLPKTHFYSKLPELSSLRASIEAVLSCHADLDISYDRTECQWSCKQAHMGCLCEITINMHWDAAVMDHIVVVKRASGTVAMGAASPVTTLFHALQTQILGEGNFVAPPVRRVATRALPLPMPVRSSSGSVSGSRTPAEDFLVGIRPIFSMVRCPLSDVRLEAAKMLHDLSGKSCELLNVSECVEQCCEALSALMMDEDSEEVKMVALMALECFLQLNSYQAHLSKRMAVLECMVGLVVSSQQDGVLVRRRAGQCLMLMRQRHAAHVARAFIALGFATQEQWMQCTSNIRDEAARVAACMLGDCFASEAASVDCAEVLSTGGLCGVESF